jgi:hypothetical protein
MGEKERESPHPGQEMLSGWEDERMRGDSHLPQPSPGPPCSDRQTAPLTDGDPQTWGNLGSDRLPGPPDVDWSLANGHLSRSQDSHWDQGPVTAT